MPCKIPETTAGRGGDFFHALPNSVSSGIVLDSTSDQVHPDSAQTPAIHGSQRNSVRSPESSPALLPPGHHPS